MSESRKVIVVRERTIGAFFADLITFSVICGSFWFNYTAIGGNDALDILLFLVFFIFAIGRAGDIRRQVLKDSENHNE